MLNAEKRGGGPKTENFADVMCVWSLGVPVVGVDVVLSLVGPLPAEGQRLVGVQLGRELELLRVRDLGKARLV